MKAPVIPAKNRLKDFIQGGYSLALTFLALVILLVFAMGSLTEAQAKTSTEILSSVWADPRLKLHKESKSLVTSAKSLNPLDKADLRVDRGQLEQDDVKYSLRFYPKGFAEHRTTQEFQSSLEKNENAAYEAMLSQLLAAQYDLLARIALTKEKAQWNQELLALSGKSRKALAYSAQKDRNEIKSLLKSRSDMAKDQIQTAELDREHESLQEELKEKSLGSLESIDLEDFASMEDLEKRVALISDPNAFKSLSSKLAEQELATTRAEMDYDRAKDEKWFDHVEVSISDIRKETVYGFEFAFNLPFASAPNLSRVGKEAKDLREKAKLIDTVKASDKIFQNSLLELKTLFNLHKSLKKSQSLLDGKNLKKITQRIASQDPLLALELQKGWLEGKVQVSDVEYRIRTLYIMYLHESATLANQPEIHHLSKSQRKIAL